MEVFRKGSAAALAGRIMRKEPLPSDELVAGLGGNRRWVSAARNGGHLFSVQDPCGMDHFPAFYADGTVDRRALGVAGRLA